MSEGRYLFSVDAPNYLLLNPKTSEKERADLHELKDYFDCHVGPRGYYLVPSSGSSKRLDESVKVVALSVDSLLNSASRVNDYLSSDSRDVWGLVLPTFHVAGLGIMARGHMSGATVIEEQWDKQKFCSWVRANKISLTSLVPAQVYDLCSLGEVCPSTLRAVFVGAGLLQEKIRSQMNDLGWPLVECYGMTETSSMVAVREKGQEFYQLMKGVSAELDGRQCLAIGCSSLLSATIQKIKDEVILKRFSESQFQTDDMAMFQLDGGQKRLKLLGRAGDYFKINGEGVSLAELKSRLDAEAFDHGSQPQALELLAIPDERSGYKIILVYEKRIGNAVFELMRRYNQQCRPYERIHQAVAVEHFPRTELAKLKKAELQATIEAILQGGSYG